MIKIIMHGCNGKMGQVISRLVAEEPNAAIVAGIDPFIGRENPYPVFQTLEECTVTGDVLIDFSNAKVIDHLLKYGVSKKLPMVICTTGIQQDTITRIHEASREIPILFSANMSLGVNLLVNLVKKAAAILAPANFDIEIIEKHHNQKVDAPSGTALYIADEINKELNKEYQYQYDRTTERIKRPKKEIGIHAVRGGTIVGEHSIIFAGQDEILEITHSALSKEIFAVGAVNAAKFLYAQKPGLYNMGDVIQ